MDDLGVGEEVVLTLADRGILDEKGNLDEAGDDELENVRLAEERKRKKAREAAAPKAKPLWEEDGKRRGILDKCVGCGSVEVWGVRVGRVAGAGRQAARHPGQVLGAWKCGGVGCGVGKGSGRKTASSAASWTSAWDVGACGGGGCLGGVRLQG